MGVSRRTPDSNLTVLIRHPNLVFILILVLILILIRRLVRVLRRRRRCRPPDREALY